MLNATVSHHAVLDRVSAVLDPQKNYEWVLDEEGDGACVTDDRMIKVGAGWMERMGHEHLIAASCAHENGDMCCLSIMERSMRVQLQKVFG